MKVWQRIFFVAMSCFAFSCNPVSDEQRLSDADDLMPGLTPRWVDESDEARMRESLKEEGRTGRKTPALKKVSAKALPELVPDGDLSSFRVAVSRQMARCERQDLKKLWRFGTRLVSRKTWCLDTGYAFLEMASRSNSFKDFWVHAKNELDWYRSTGLKGRGKVKFTGYYIPVMDAQRIANEEFHYPIYKRPSDLYRIKTKNGWRWRRKTEDGQYVLYHDRKQIDWQGAIEGNGWEIVYTNNPVEAFFMHIQGSGVVRIKNEKNGFDRRMVNYAGQNGHKYVGIGGVLKREGVDGRYLTLQGLRKYFSERPHEIDRVFPMNPSYIFFNESVEGPFGSGGTELVAGHSIATDNRLFALGSIGVFTAKRPEVINGKIIRWNDFSRLAVNQDTGGAIKGAGRVDIFWGEGEYAELAAGGQNHIGELFFALKRK